MRQLAPLPIIAAKLLIALALIGCVSGTTEEPRETASEPTRTSTEVSREIAILAHRLVSAYMSDKPWGFFGATCEQWIEEDYYWEPSMSERETDDRIVVTYERKPERILGPLELIFFVEVDTGEVVGDNESESGRSGVAEGCDKW